MANDQLRLFSDFEDYRVFVLSNRKKKMLHSLSEENMRILLKKIYPESHPVTECNINGGRVDLIYYFDALGHTIHFEIFASYYTVINDLRLLEQSEFDIKVGILIDDDIDPSVSKKYFRKRPTKPFPFLNLSQIFMGSKIDDFQRDVVKIINAFQLRPDSDITDLRKSFLRCYESIRKLCYFRFDLEKYENLNHKDEIEKSLTLLNKYKEELSEHLDFYFDIKRLNENFIMGMNRPNYKITLDKVKIEIIFNVSGGILDYIVFLKEIEFGMVLYKSDLDPFLNELREKLNV